MKINHKTVREVLKAIGIAIFIISVFIKLRKIFLYGGTRVVRVDEDGDEIPDTLEVTSDDVPVAFETEYEDDVDGEADEVTEAYAPDEEAKPYPYNNRK